MEWYFFLLDIIFWSDGRKYNVTECTWFIRISSNLLFLRLQVKNWIKALGSVALKVDSFLKYLFPWETVSFVFLDFVWGNKTKRNVKCILFTQLNASLSYVFFLTVAWVYSGSQTLHQVIIQWCWKTNIYERISIRDEAKQFDYHKKEIIIIIQHTDTVCIIECIVV